MLFVRSCVPLSVILDEVGENEGDDGGIQVTGGM